jgi:hypothetical protein
MEILEISTREGLKKWDRRNAAIPWRVTSPLRLPGQEEKRALRA